MITSFQAVKMMCLLTGSADLNQVFLMLTGFNGGFYGVPDMLICPPKVKAASDVELQSGSGMKSLYF